MTRRYCVTKQVESSSNRTWYLVMDQRTSQPVIPIHTYRKDAQESANYFNQLQEQKLNRLARLQTLRLVGAPRWIVKCEQVYLIAIRSRRERYDLMEKYVTPIMGQGSITVPSEPEIARRCVSETARIAEDQQRQLKSSVKPSCNCRVSKMTEDDMVGGAAGHDAWCASLRTSEEKP